MTIMLGKKKTKQQLLLVEGGGGGMQQKGIPPIWPQADGGAGNNLTTWQTRNKMAPSRLAQRALSDIEKPPTIHLT